MTRPVAVPTRPVKILAWLNVAMTCLFVIIGLGTGWALIWGPPGVHQGPSMLLVRGLGLSWVGWGILFILYAVLLTNRRSRVAGWIGGFILFAFFTTSLIVATFQGHLKSAPLLGMSIAATAGQVSAAIRAMVIAEER